MDVWVVYRTKTYSVEDWDREIVGVYATLDAARDDVAARQAQTATAGYARRPCHDTPLDTTALGPWEEAAVDDPYSLAALDWPREASRPHERWYALPDPSLVYPWATADVEFHAERWTVEG